jgi:hypothetical protein
VSNPRDDLGYSGSAQPLSVQELYPELDPLLLQRKGRLVLLVTDKADREALIWLCREFYESRTYDPIPTLVHCLAQAYRDHLPLPAELPLALVLRGLELNMVGTDQAVVRLMRYGVVRDLFNAQAARSGSHVAMTRQATSPQIPPIYSAQWRLVTGDVLLVTVQSVAQRVGEGALRRVVRLAGSAGRAATLLARLPRVPGAAPILMMRQGQFSPVPEMQGAKPPPESEQQAQRHRRRGWSPIWPALLIALLAIVVTVWATGIHVEMDNLQEYLLMMFFPPVESTPTPEATTPEEVAEPAEPLPYAAPALVSPYEGARLEGAEIILSWEWARELGADQFFEVILRPAGDDPEARTLTRVERHMVSIGADGWYAWSVRVVDGQDRQNPEPLSPEAAPISFHWRAE